MRNERLFSIQTDVYKLEKELKKLGIANLKWSSVVETFSKSFEYEKELIQLLSISEIDDTYSEDKQRFFKSIFKVINNDDLYKMLDSTIIDREEYYDKLLTIPSDSIQNKIRLDFNYKESEYSIDLMKNTSFKTLKVTSDYTRIGIPTNTILESIEIIDEIKQSREEVAYKDSLVLS